MIRAILEWRREIKRKQFAQAHWRRKKLVGFTTWDTVYSHEGFRNPQQLTDEICCALLRPGLYQWRDKNPDRVFEMDALPDGAMRVRALAGDGVVAEHVVSRNAVYDYFNGYDGGYVGLMARCRQAVVDEAGRTR